MGKLGRDPPPGFGLLFAFAESASSAAFPVTLLLLLVFPLYSLVLDYTAMRTGREVDFTESAAGDLISPL